MSTGRREANKERTREALIDATYALLHEEGAASLTAERVADAAGISRRTFFNYFPSVEAVVAHRARQVLETVSEHLRDRPLDEHLIDSAQAVIDELFTLDLLDETTRTWRAIDATPGATRYALEAHTEIVVEFTEDWARTRLAAVGEPPDSLRPAVLAAAALGAFEIGRRAWLAGQHGPVDEAAREAFVARIHEALDVLRPAVPAPARTPRPDPNDR